MLKLHRLFLPAALWALTPNVVPQQVHSSAPDAHACAALLSASMTHMHQAMAQVAPTGEFDADFMKLMIPHHEAALEMAKAELFCGKDATTRRLAQEIITDQQSEIDLMKLWLQKHATTGRPASK